MTFVLLKPWNGNPEGVWWEWDEQNMKLRNFMGGGFDIDENSDYWAHAVTLRGCDSWHDIYEAYGQNPLESDVTAFDAWISPNGEFFEGNAHRVQAEYICNLVYGIDVDDPLFMGEAEDYLIGHGWIKATRSFMWSIYQQRDTTWKMTQKTYDALFDYCTTHKLKMPKDIDIISSETAELGGIYGPDNINW